MIKKVGIVFLIVLILNIVLLVLYLTSNKGKKEDVSQNTYEIFSEAENFDKYPEIAWKDITSGKLLNFLENQDKEGKLPLISENAELISAPSISNEELYQANGLASIQMTNEDVSFNKYKNIEIRPFRYVAFFKTNLGDTNYLVLIQKWLNPDGSIVFLPLIVSEPLAVEGEQRLERYLDLVANNSVYFLGPILKIENLERCKIALLGRESYCDWYFQDPETRNSFLKIIEEWTKSNNIIKEAGKMPMLFSIARLVKD